MQKGGVKVQLKTEATPNLVRKLEPEALIIATGSDFIVPRVPGCDKACAIVADDVLLGRRPVGEKVVVIGAGLIGCETALYLADELKKQVTIVEMLDDMLVGVSFMVQEVIKARLKEAGVEVNLGWHLDEIMERGATCTDKEWQRHILEADSVVLATGLGARSETIDQFRGLVPEMYVIGDCVEARKIYHCFEDAWRVALQI